MVDKDRSRGHRAQGIQAAPQEPPSLEELDRQEREGERKYRKQVKRAAEFLLGNQEYKLVVHEKLQELRARHGATLEDHTIVGQAETLLAKGALWALGELHEYVRQMAEMNIPEEDESDEQ